MVPVLRFTCRNRLLAISRGRVAWGIEGSRSPPYARLPLTSSVPVRDKLPYVPGRRVEQCQAGADRLTGRGDARQIDPTCLEADGDRRRWHGERPIGTAPCVNHVDKAPGRIGRAAVFRPRVLRPVW